MAISSVLLIHSSRGSLLRESGGLTSSGLVPSQRSRAAVTPVGRIQSDEPTLEFVDVLELSPQALAQVSRETAPTAASGREPTTVDDETNGVVGLADEQLSEEEQQQVRELEARDREVRAHEQAHIAAAGPYALGPPSYEFQQGPDGRNYAVGGEVQIDTSPVEGDPEATIRKAQVVRAAALAPAEPSAQDRSVAAAATQQQAAAQAELLNQEESTSAAPAEQDLANSLSSPGINLHDENALATTLLTPLAQQIPISQIDLQA